MILKHFIMSYTLYTPFVELIFSFLQFIVLCLHHLLMVAFLHHPHMGNQLYHFVYQLNQVGNFGMNGTGLLQPILQGNWVQYLRC